MKLKYQLFITLLVASALLIALMLAVSSWSFNRGFIGYVNSAEKARLAPLVENLAETYRQQNGWHWTETNKALWNDLLISNRVERRLGQLRPSSRRGPPPGAQHKPGQNPHNRLPDKKRPRQNRRPPPPRRIIPWLLLADAEQSVLIDPANSGKDNIEWLPVTNADETVGYLGFTRYRQLNREIDKVFAQQQKRSFGYAALGMVLLSALLSIPLSSRIIKPLLTVNKAVDEISHGNFGYRVPPGRKDEFGDLANHINSLAHRLNENKTARQRWIAEISHELRTPVAVLQSEIEAIQDGIRQADTQSIESLHHEVLQLSRLINDLHQLSLSDIGALEYQMTSLPLNEVVDEFLTANLQALADAGLQPQLSINHATILGDHQRIIQLLENLLQNSIRYTRPEGTLQVTLKTENDTAVLCWADSAPGVDETDLAKLFDPLYRTEQSRNRQHGGSGLGLAIVKKIVAAHEGQIVAQHAPLGGLEITISIPLQPDSVT